MMHIVCKMGSAEKNHPITRVNSQADQHPQALSLSFFSWTSQSRCIARFIICAQRLLEELALGSAGVPDEADVDVTA